MSKTIYIILTETGSLLSRAIQVYTQKNFNHVSIAFDPELKEMYSFGRKYENNPLIGGFVIKVGDKQLDESIAGKLNKLERHFINQGV